MPFWVQQLSEILVFIFRIQILPTKGADSIVLLEETIRAD